MIAIRAKKQYGNNYWVITVLLLSPLCYLPMLLKRLGVYIPGIFLNARYLFVLIPLVCSIIFEIKEHTLKQWYSSLLINKNHGKSILMCVLFIIVGLSTSYGYSIVVGKPNLFVDSYPKIPLAIVNCIYLFIMALLEEAAWRGFFLKRISGKQEKIRYTIYTGVIWGLWHIPMWSIRNLLTVREIIFFFIWTVLLALIIGVAYYKYQSVLILAFLHTVFNTCFLAPVEWNVMTLVVVVSVFIGFNKVIKRSDLKGR